MSSFASLFTSRAGLRVGVLLLGCAQLAWQTPAAAQATGENRVAAEALFDRGLSLMRQGKYEAACRQLEQSQSLDRGIGTMLYLAECYERLGRTASAWALFREASSAARAQGHDARARAGATRAAALEGKLAKLTLRVPDAQTTPGLELRRDGELVPSGLWNVPMPVDPGEHRIEARAPNRQSFSQLVRVAPADENASVTIPALDAAQPSPLAQNPAPGMGSLMTAPGAQPDASNTTNTTNTSNTGDTRDTDFAAAPSSGAAITTRDQDSGSTQRTIGIVVGAAGVAALGVGLYFGASALSDKNEADDRCPSGARCSDPAGVAANQDAQDAASLSNVFVIGGAVLAATGIIVLLTAPSDEGPRLAVQASPHAARVTLTGAL